MTIFSVSLLSEHPDKVTLSGAIHNLIWVTIGNLISGAILMGFGYWVAAGRPRLDKFEQEIAEEKLATTATKEENAEAEAEGSV